MDLNFSCMENADNLRYVCCVDLRNQLRCLIFFVVFSNFFDQFLVGDVCFHIGNLRG